jgi:arsenic resistance protein ArsH
LLDGAAAEGDWVRELDLSGAASFRPNGPSAATHPPRILVLYGSLRPRSYSRLLAYEFARILDHLGCEVCTWGVCGVFGPLPVAACHSTNIHMPIAQPRPLFASARFE